jgi:cell wall assembly regulator SMI1
LHRPSFGYWGDPVGQKMAVMHYEEDPNVAPWAKLLDRPEVVTRPGTTRAALDTAGAKLNVTFPAALSALYLQSDGVWDRDGQWYVIWPLDELVERHGDVGGARTWLAFGDDGTGNPFCIHADGSISYWSEVVAEHAWLASDLESFWSAWLRDELPPH